MFNGHMIYNSFNEPHYYYYIGDLIYAQHKYAYDMDLFRPNLVPIENNKRWTKYDRKEQDYCTS